MAPKSLEDRFWRQVRKEAEGGCWLWTGHARMGYGRISSGGDGRRLLTVHRLSWQLAGRGEIPDGLHVLHRCDVPLCVNPEHLFLGKPRDNAADKALKWRGRTGRYKYGVHRQVNGTWEARVRFRGVLHPLGTFATEDEAHAVAVAAKKRFYGLDLAA